MDSFTNNLTEWSIEGNIIGLILGELTDLSGFTNSNAEVTGTTREMAGQSIAFIQVNYAP